MKLRNYRHRWGITEARKTLFPTIREPGYSGIEHILPEGRSGEIFIHHLGEHGFDYIALHENTGRESPGYP